MQMLKAKLYMLKKEEEEAKLAGIRGEVKDIAWGSQIRSYVLQPCAWAPIRQAAARRCKGDRESSVTVSPV